MGNTISELNNHLFDQIERLSNKDLSAEELKLEIARGKSISSVASQIVNGAKVQLEAIKYVNEIGDLTLEDKTIKLLIGE